MGTSMSIWKFLGLQGKGPAGKSSSEAGEDAETIRKITRALEELPPDQSRFIAAFAFILSRVAHADLEISEDETREMERIVKEMGSVPEAQAVLVVQIAKTQSLLFGGTENFLVTREFNKFATREDKMKLLECLFAVSSSDEEISSAEDTEIRQISRELLLEHNDFIAVRSGYREHLSVLKKSSGK